MRRLFLDAVDFVSQFILLACVGILPLRALNWLAVNLPGRKADPPFVMVGQAEQHCIDQTARELSGE